MLRKILSGGQTGSDLAGLVTAKQLGFATGGMMPKGFKNHNGLNPEFAELYGMQEHASPLYQPRTFENIKNSDGTLRLAFDFTTAGERCTLKGIQKYKKPYFDVNLNNPCDPQLVVDWLTSYNIQVLNVAGNSEKTYFGTHIAAAEFLSEVFKMIACCGN